MSSLASILFWTFFDIWNICMLYFLFQSIKTRNTYVVSKLKRVFIHFANIDKNIFALAEFGSGWDRKVSWCTYYLSTRLYLQPLLYICINVNFNFTRKISFVPNKTAKVQFEVCLTCGNHTSGIKITDNIRKKDDDEEITRLCTKRKNFTSSALTKA